MCPCRCRRPPKTLYTPPTAAVWLYHTAKAITSDRGLLKSEPAESVPGSVAITIDGSSKGGLDFTAAGLRFTWSATAHSQFGVHPFGVAKIKEKDKPLDNAPLQCFLNQLGYVPRMTCGCIGLEMPAPACHTTALQIVLFPGHAGA